jgi:hypothetical protein
MKVAVDRLVRWRRLTSHVGKLASYEHPLRPRGLAERAELAARSLFNDLQQRIPSEMQPI